MNINNINSANINNCCSSSICRSKNNDKHKVSFNGKREIRQFLRWMSKNFSSPQQRAVLGVTALCTQPFIDLHNKHIKQEEKSIVVSKTIAKIIVGTTVGVLMRHYAIKAVQNFTQKTNVGKYSQCLLPQKIIQELKNNFSEKLENSVLNYKNAIGTFLGLSCCIFTNFAIDAPLTKILTNVINDKVFNKEKKNVK